MIFKKGDIITFNDKLKGKCSYKITNGNMISAEILRIDYNILTIKILEHYNKEECGSIYFVEPKFFIIKNNKDEYLLS